MGYNMAPIEVECSNHIELYFSTTFAPGGYAWMFPQGKDRGNVGMGVASPKYRINRFFDGFIKFDRVAKRKFSNGERLEYTGGVLPGPPVPEKTVADGLMISKK